jgi:hypothetical protein
MEFARFIRNPTPVPIQAPAENPAGPGIFYFSMDLGAGFAYSVVLANVQLDLAGQPVSEPSILIFPYSGFSTKYNNPAGVFGLSISVAPALPNSTLIVQIVQAVQFAAPIFTALGALVSGSTTNAIVVV